MQAINRSTGQTFPLKTFELQPQAGGPLKVPPSSKPTQLPGEAAKELKPLDKNTVKTQEQGTASTSVSLFGDEGTPSPNVVPGSVKSGAENVSQELKEKMKQIKAGNIPPGMKKIEPDKDGEANVIKGSVKSGAENVSQELKEKMKQIKAGNIPPGMKKIEPQKDGEANAIKGSVKSGAEHASESIKKAAKEISKGKIPPGMTKIKPMKSDTPLSPEEMAKVNAEKKAKILADPKVSDEMKDFIKRDFNDPKRWEGKRRISPDAE